MKNKVLAMLLAAVPVVGFVACDDDDNDNNDNNSVPVSVISSSNSECLTNSLGYWDNLGKDDAGAGHYAYCEYAYDSLTGNVQLIVKDIERNCATKPVIKASINGNNIDVDFDTPKGIFSGVNEEGDTLYAVADCYCIYSDTLVLGNLTNNNTYLLSVKNDSLIGKSEINLSAKKSASFYIDEVSK